MVDSSWWWLVRYTLSLVQSIQSSISGFPWIVTLLSSWDQSTFILRFKRQSTSTFVCPQMMLWLYFWEKNEQIRIHKQWSMFNPMDNIHSIFVTWFVAAHEALILMYLTSLYCCWLVRLLLSRSVDKGPKLHTDPCRLTLNSKTLRRSQTEPIKYIEILRYYAVA